ncbi:MAG: helix-turn-helix domain-containing protein [Pseudomonadota bacterium]
MNTPLGHNSALRVPAQAEAYVEALGLDMAIEFMIEFGGTVVILGENPRRDNAVARRFGIEAARALAKVSDRLQARVPKQDRWVARILKARGMTRVEIARTLRVTDETVRRYLRGEPVEASVEDRTAPDSRQLSLPL